MNLYFNQNNELVFDQTNNTMTDNYNLFNGLVARWKFEEGSGTIFYDSVSSQNGTVIGSAGWSSGRVGNYGFISPGTAGSYGRVLDTSALRLNGAFSIAFWIKAITKIGSFPCVLSKGIANVAGSAGWQIFYTGTLDVLSAISFKRDNKYISMAASSGATIGTNWSHVVYTHNGITTGKSYFNGQFNVQTNVSFVTNTSTANLTFHAQSPGDQNLDNGVLDDVRIYNRVLTDVEITTLYSVTI